MSTIHKCDKCGKAIKENNKIDIAFSDMNKRFFEKGYNSFDFCEECVKPLAVYLKGFLKNNKKNK